jgi:hypothetical protein
MTRFLAADPLTVPNVVVHPDRVAVSPADAGRHMIELTYRSDGGGEHARAAARVLESEGLVARVVRGRDGTWMVRCEPVPHEQASKALGRIAR